MLQLKKKIATFFFLALLSSAVVISCGKKAETESSDQTVTEQDSTAIEHPADSTASEHPSDSEHPEHPSDSTENN
jgi:hypothetical protein